MNVWSISDLHLSFGVPDKEMDLFGEKWSQHPEKIATHWKELIQPEDLVCIAGDISWALHPEEAIPDLEWIDQLPGTKVLIKGNHDGWFSSKKKIAGIIPPSLHMIHNDSFVYQDIGIAGSRLWDAKEFNFDNLVGWKKEYTPEDEKIYQRELMRLERSLQSLPEGLKHKIVMTHYPPVSLQLEDSPVSALLDKYQVDVCLFGHLHSVDSNLDLFGKKNNTNYVFTSCDYLNFTPIRVELH